MNIKFGKWFLVTMLVFIFALVGCSNNSDETSSPTENDENDSTEETGTGTDAGPEDVTIRVAWWGGQERHDRTLEVIELFEAEYPHITVEPEYTGWDGYWERLSTQAAGSNLPDVINMDNSRLNEYYANNLLVDLTPFIEEGLINLDDVDDVYQDINVFGDEVIAISLGANALGISFNRDMAEEYGITFEPGYTYEDLYDMMLEIKEAKGDEEFFGFDLANAEYEMFFTYARQHGQSVYNAEGNGLGFEEQTLVDFFTWVQTMVKDGAAPSHDITMEYIDGGNSMLQEGSAFAQMAASNQIIGHAAGTDYELGLNILPTLEGGEHGNWIRPSMSFSISSHAQEKEAAALFIDFFTNSLEANEILMADRGVPVSQAVRDHLAPLVDGPVLETFEFLELVAEYSREADPLSPPGETEVRGSFLRVVEMLKYDRLTPEEAAQQFIQEASAVLN
ncbi:multiple sugar transport system substrate-binding protein [Evansella vedderi]|uniref:Multiple sugar transport system substrate-binding protein n=1 Tax=Evansella vedderi TaxID=38282 RepID=A0ABT9ZPN5_9BACI|nr:extracellular solute-binding protein [Evansella vedderi]MDQ0253201.1 multiple sugar transport system substrate-binding protein [Evansella vedderi]